VKIVGVWNARNVADPQEELLQNRIFNLFEYPGIYPGIYRNSPLQGLAVSDGTDGAVRTGVPTSAGRSGAVGVSAVLAVSGSAHGHSVLVVLAVLWCFGGASAESAVSGSQGH
jgi:hypothetical protein